MKTILLLVSVFFLISCNADSTKVNHEGTNQDKTIKSPCLVASMGSTVNFIGKDNNPLYYIRMDGTAEYDFSLIVSEFDVSKAVQIDSKYKYSYERSKKLVKCLEAFNKSIYVQDLWLEMKGSLDEEDSTRIIGKDGYYPDELYISQPNLDTFKIDGEGAEIKSYIFSPVSDTYVTTIKWKFKDGKYVFDKYTTRIRSED